MYTDRNNPSFLNKEKTKQRGTVYLRMVTHPVFKLVRDIRPQNQYNTNLHFSLIKHGSRYWSSEELLWQATKHFNSNDTTWFKKSAPHCICAPNDNSARSYVIPPIMLLYHTCTLCFFFFIIWKPLPFQVLCRSDENLHQSSSCSQKESSFPFVFLPEWQSVCRWGQWPLKTGIN